MEKTMLFPNKITRSKTSMFFMLAAAAIYAPKAAAVSATPGVFQGVITFNSSSAAPTVDFVPDSVTIDARDSTNTYSAHAVATQGGIGCAMTSQNWCYSITVESALAQTYSLRPIAFIVKSSPYIFNRIPFPPLDGVAITPGATVTGVNITYQPGEISGNVTAEDLSNAAIPIRSAYFSMNDNDNTFQDPFTGSVEFFPFNSVFNAAAASNYQLYLKPGHHYTYLSQAITLAENMGTAHTLVTYYGSPGQLYGLAPAAGTNVNVPYDFQQSAAITGTATAPPGFSVYNLEVDTTATSAVNPSLGVAGNYITDNTSGNPLTSPIAYAARIFNPADLTKPINVRPVFTLSADGGTYLQYPYQQIPGNSVTPGSTFPRNFGGTSGAIAGNIIFDPPYPAKLFYPGIQAETADLGSAATRLVKNPSGGSYSLPVFVGDWQYWRWGWDFDLNDSNFTSNYFVSQFVNVHVPVTTPGSTVNKDWNFDTALLKVYFTAPIAPTNTTLSDPQLDAQSGFLNGGVFTQDPDADTAHSEGLNQNGKNVGEAHMVLRVHNNTLFRVKPSAVINLGGVPGSGRTDFSPFYVTPHKGDVIVAGVPGSLSMIVNTPTDGQKLATCVIPVTGSATGAPNITIKVNGATIAATSAGDLSDPYKVIFSSMVAGGGPTTITVTASAPNNSTVTDVLKVTATSAAVNVSSSVGTPLLWPPNHDLVNVGLAATAATACDQNPTIGVSVYSNESDTEDTGSGNFSPDAKDAAPGALRLRSERKGDGDGRVYLIVSKGSDHYGDSGYACSAVIVPQNHSAASVAGITAVANAAVASCKPNGTIPAGYVQVGSGPIIGPKQ